MRPHWPNDNDRTEISPNEDIKNNPDINLLFVSIIARLARARVRASRHISLIQRFNNTNEKVFCFRFCRRILFVRFHQDIIDDRQRRREGRRMYAMAQVALWNNFLTPQITSTEPMTPSPWIDTNFCKHSKAMNEYRLIEYIRLTGGNSLTSMIVMTKSPLPCCSVGAVVSVTTMVSRTTAKKSRSSGPLTVTLPNRSTANRCLNDALSVTSLPFLLTAVIGSSASNANASLDTMSGSCACNCKIRVPISASSRTSARCVAGMKYGSLSLLFMMSTESVVVADRLGMPAIWHRRMAKSVKISKLLESMTFNNFLPKSDATNSMRYLSRLSKSSLRAIVTNPVSLSIPKSSKLPCCMRYLKRVWMPHRRCHALCVMLSICVWYVRWLERRRQSNRFGRCRIMWFPCFDSRYKLQN